MEEGQDALPAMEIPVAELQGNVSNDQVSVVETGAILPQG